MVSNEPRSTEQTPTESALDGPDGGVSHRLLAPDTAELAPLRTWIDVLLAPQIAAEERHLFLVAITEAATNAIEAHRRAGVEAAVEVDVDRSSRLVVIEDHGGGIEYEAADGPTIPAPSAARGRGLLIIQSICPSARFIETETGARVELPYPS